MEREYKLIYTVDDNQAIGKLNNIRNAIYQVHQEATKNVGAMNAGAAALQNFSATGVNAFRNVSAAAAVMNTTVQNAGAGVGHLGSQAEALMPRWQALEYGVQIAMKFGEEIEKAREHMRELGRETMVMRDGYRELAQLMGHAAPDDEVVAATAIKGLETGMKPEEARKFMEQFEGAIPAGRDLGNVQKGDEDEIAKEGMKFARRYKVDPKTAGELTGIIAQFGKTDPQDTKIQLEKIARNLNDGRGNLQPLVQMLINTAGQIVDEKGGAVTNLPDLAAIGGVASTSANPARAGMHVIEATRGLRRFEGKQGDALKRMGITPQMKFREALEKIAPLIQEADKSGEGADVMMRRVGFGREEESRGIIHLARNVKVVQKRIDRNNTQNVLKDVKERERLYRASKVGQAEGIHAESKARDFLVGRPQETLEMAREAGANRLRERHLVGGAGNTTRQILESAMNLAPFGKRGSQMEAENQFVEDLKLRARKVGVDVNQEYIDMHPSRYRTKDPRHEAMFPGQLLFDADGGKFIEKMIDKVQAKGVNPYGDQTKVISELREVVKETQKTNELLRQGNVPQAGPGAGAARPVRK